MPLIRHDGKARGLWGLFLVPANLIFGVTLSYRMRTGEIIHDLFYWVMISIMVADLLLDLLSTRKNRMDVVTDWKSVLNLYARGWMIPDILAAIPFEYLADTFHWESTWLLMLRVLPLSKTFKVSTVLADLQLHLQMPSALMKLMSLGYWVIQAVHAFALGWWWVGGSPDELETTPAKTAWVMEDNQLVQKNRG